MRSLIGMTAMMAVGGITGAAAPAAEKTADYSFDYSYPQEAARIPALSRQSRRASAPERPSASCRRHPKVCSTSFGRLPTANP